LFAAVSFLRVDSPKGWRTGKVGDKGRDAAARSISALREMCVSRITRERFERAIVLMRGGLFCWEKLVGAAKAQAVEDGRF